MNIKESRYCVIMCGGVGSRFWPYSREKKPKQFIDFLGTGRSLLQMSIDRISKLIPIENIIIATNASYLDLIKSQCPYIDSKNILLEPVRRNTAPCIAWAALHIYQQNPKASMIVLPSDHVITDHRAFEKGVLEGFEFVEKEEAILTLGIIPTKPETGYGYINFGQNIWKNIYKVNKFTEKPKLELAQLFLAEGTYLWNAGIFLWRVETILKELNTYAPGVLIPFQHKDDIDDIEDIFPNCEAISIDYAVLEKSDKIYVEKANIGWSDLGTWSSLYELSEKDINN